MNLGPRFVFGILRVFLHFYRLGGLVLARFFSLLFINRHGTEKSALFNKHLPPDPMV